MLTSHSVALQKCTAATNDLSIDNSISVQLQNCLNNVVTSAKILFVIIGDLMWPMLILMVEAHLLQYDNNIMLFLWIRTTISVSTFLILHYTALKQL